MPTVDLSSYKVVLNELSSSTKFDNLVQAIQDALNGLDNANITPTAAVAVSKLAAGTNGQALQTVAGVPTWAALPAAGVQILDKVSTDVTIASSVTETSIYTKSIAGGTIGANGILLLHLWGNGQTDVGTALETLKVKFGGTVVIDTGAAALDTTGALLYQWEAWIRVQNDAATNAQTISIHFYVNTGGAAFTTGTGRISSGAGAGGSWHFRKGFNTSALDTTLAQTLDVTWTHSTNAATETVTMRGASLLLIA